MKDDERAFLAACLERCSPSGTDRPRDVIDQDQAIAPKRAWYLLEKWAGKDWYDYGVCLDLGWFYPDRIPSSIVDSLKKARSIS